jgi:hypothetical protein
MRKVNALGELVHSMVGLPMYWSRRPDADGLTEKLMEYFVFQE